MDSNELSKLLKELYLLKGWHAGRLKSLPLRTRFGLYRNKIRRRVKYGWNNAIYVRQENDDFFYIPEKLDRQGKDLLLLPCPQNFFIKKFCKPGATVIDIGANIGQWSLQMAKAVGDSGRLISLEPIPMMCDAVNKTLRVNGFFHAKCFQFAASNEPGQAYLNFNISDKKVADTGLSSLEYQLSDSNKIEVEKIVLDDFLSERKIIDISFMKVDVEGHEYAVLQGAARTLATDRPVLIIEVGNETAEERAAIYTFLNDLDYELIGMDIEHSNGRYGIIPTKREEFINHSNISNFLFTPK